MRIAILFFIFTANSFAQTNNGWINYTNNSNVRDMVMDGDWIWCATNGGLVKFNNVTQEKIWFNVANSDIITHDITCVKLDRKKNIWIGTQSNGLLKFDGHKWINFNEENFSLLSIKIKDIAFDLQNTAWIATDEGLIEFNNSVWKSYGISNPFQKTRTINAVEIDSKNSLWIASGNGIYRRSNNIWKCFFADTSSDWNHKNNFRNVLIDSTNNLYTSSADTLFIITHINSDTPSIRKKKISRPSTMTISSDNQFHFSYLLPQNSFFYLHYGGCGIGIIENDSINYTEFRNEAQWSNFIDSGEELYSTIQSMLVKNDTIWIGTELNGLFQIINNQTKRISLSPTPLPSNEIVRILSVNNDLWVSTKFGGLVQISEQEWIKHNIQSILNIKKDNWYKSYYISNGIPIGVDWQNNILIEAQRYAREDQYDTHGWFEFNGHATYDGYNWTYWEWAPWSLLTIVTHDSKRRMYFGGEDGFFRVTDSDTTKFVSDNSPLPYNKVSALHVDSEDILWISTGYKDYWTSETEMGSFSNLSDKTWMVFDSTNSPITSKTYITSIVSDKDFLWLSTSGGILRMSLSNFSWSTFTTRNSCLTSNNIYDLQIDKYSRVWFTGDGLIGFLYQNSFKIFSALNGDLPINNHAQISITKNYIWLSTSDKGLFVKRLNEFELVNNSHTIPQKYSLSQNYPNPFNPTTKINYTIKRPGLTKLVVYDILGNKVCELVNNYRNIGTHEVEFDADNLTSGVYFYRLETNDFFETKKMMVLK